MIAVKNAGWLMGGLVTILKVRDNLRSYDEDPGWFKHPPELLR